MFNFTAFQYVTGEKVLYQTWNVNGKISRYSSEFSGKKFSEVFGVSGLGEEFIAKFLSALQVEETSKLLKATKRKERTA